MNTKIVLIDDDEDDRMLFREAVKSSGYEESNFSEYSSAQRFIEYMQESRFSIPWLIFLDISMPALDGYTLLKIIRKDERFNDSNIVIFTTSNNTFDIELAQQNLASGFAAKPADYQSLELIIKNAIQYFSPPKNKLHFFTMI